MVSCAFSKENLDIFLLILPMEGEEKTSCTAGCAQSGSRSFEMLIVFLLVGIARSLGGYGDYAG